MERRRKCEAAEAAGTTAQLLLEQLRKKKEVEQIAIARCVVFIMYLDSFHFETLLKFDVVEEMRRCVSEKVCTKVSLSHR